MLPDSRVAGTFAEGQFSMPCRVYYEDTDAGGVMYYANYLRFAERARTEALRACGIEQRALAEQGFLLVVKRCEIDYKAPALLDDLIMIETSLQRSTKLRMSISQRLSRAEREIARLQVDIVTVSTALRPTPLPDEVYEKIIKHFRVLDQGEQVV